MQQNNAPDGSSNGNDDATPRKRPRKQQFSDYGSQSAKKYQSNTPEQAMYGASMNELDVNAYSNTTSGQMVPNDTQNASNCNSMKNNNENTPPKNFDYYIKRPKTCSLLDVSFVFANFKG